MTQVKGESSHLERPRLEVSLLISNDLITKKKFPQLAVVVHAFDPSTQEAEADQSL